ncbi:MAG: hypothetical protein HC903_16050 [Methylacidiphilales bacterium]|nr:hypothetical protein [Candidatus Methylacidiphilales bacterium]
MKFSNLSNNLLIQKVLFPISLLFSIAGVNLANSSYVNANSFNINDSKYSDLNSHIFTSKCIDLCLNKQNNVSPPEAATKFLYTLKGQHNYDVDSLAFTPDGQTLISGSIYNKIHVWDLKTRKVRQVFNAGKDGVNTVAISPDGSLLAAAGGFAQLDTDTTIKIWNLKTGRMILNLKDILKELILSNFLPMVKI